jgi:endonuclease/exonuclease/phosphatase family metal-dependent hydrolase
MVRLVRGIELKLCEFNLENLFISMEYYRGQDLKTLSEEDWQSVALPQLRKIQKPLSKVWAVAETIEDIDPDILMLVEVGGRDSLSNLNRHFLGARFIPHFVEGNSRRAIDLGFLVKKGLPFRAETFSNKETPIEVDSLQGKYVSRFSRDVAELRLSDDSGTALILLLTHLKSKLGSPQDFQGKDVRTAEAFALARIYQRIRSDLPGVPVVVGGDFNNNLASLELEHVLRTDLTDFHDILETPEEERFSLVHFDFAEKPNPQTLDYLLVSPELRDQIVGPKSFTYRYKGFYGIPHLPPGSFRERNQLPSDHYPLVLTVRLRSCPQPPSTS